VLAIGIGIIAAAIIYGVTSWLGPEVPQRRKVTSSIVVGLFAAGAAVAYGGLPEDRQADVVERVVAMVQGVGYALGISAVLFLGINYLFNLATERFRVFGAIIGGLVAAIPVGLVAGNGQMVSGLALTGLAFAVGAALGWFLSGITDERLRMLIGAAGGAGLAALIGFNTVPDARPQFDFMSWIVGSLVVGAVALAIAYVWNFFGGPPITLKTILGAAFIGWIFGAFGMSDLKVLSYGTAIGAWAIAGGLYGARWGLAAYKDPLERHTVRDGSRVFIFLGPALLFISVALLIPTIGTIVLSFQNRDGESVGFLNYTRLFGDSNIFDVSEWQTLFSGRLLWLGLIVLAAGFLVAFFAGRRVNAPLEWSPASGAPVAIGVTLILFAIFTSLRGVIFNNLWWVFAVTSFATVAGLSIAVLAERSRFETVAKSLVFLPMAVSFVGASVIWRFVLIARPASKPQTGLFNSIWTTLGRANEAGGIRTGILLFLAVVALGALYIGYRAMLSNLNSYSAWAGIILLLVGWVVYRMIWGNGIGGDAIQFREEQPWNSFWLMVIMIWIQTGFTMVVFSAAIKGVPTDLLEAARVDGANASQMFWRITIPQIRTTIGVVVTTLIVLVMKVFDIVKVMTAGDFGTNVLANEMWDQAFTFINRPAGAAVAVLLFISVLPIMYLNIRRMQQEAAA
jgi:alpha-glucoside transport system permease protein